MKCSNAKRTNLEEYYPLAFLRWILAGPTSGLVQKKILLVRNTALGQVLGSRLAPPDAVHKQVGNDLLAEIAGHAERFRILPARLSRRR